MASILVTMACDADLCAAHAKIQAIRETLTVEDCRRLYDYVNEEDF